MRIINNRIYIKQGETATYIAKIINRNGDPFKLTLPRDEYTNRYQVMDFMVQFIVRPGSYSVGVDKNINHYLSIGDEFIFDDDEVYNIDAPEWLGDDWSELPAPVDEERLKRLYRIKDKFSEYHYGYYDYSEDRWFEYEFEIGTTFLYEETSVMEAKKYNYEISLIGGVFNTEKNEFDEIFYKHPFLELTDFIVEGSISD